MIRKFNESIDSSHVEDIILQELDDELIEYDHQKGYFSERSLEKGIESDGSGLLFRDPTSNSDKFCHKISISLIENMKIKNARQPLQYMVPNKDRDVFSAISNITKYFDTRIKLRANNYLSVIDIYILTDREVEKKENKLHDIYLEIRSRLLKSKSDFANDTWTEFDESENTFEIKSSTWTFTDRKLKLLMRGIDIDGVDMKKTIDGSSVIIKFFEK